MFGVMVKVRVIKCVLFVHLFYQNALNPSSDCNAIWDPSKKDLQLSLTYLESE